ncbi:DEAD-box ATP-dependent RNA helicase 17-like [Hibiscus syriacus]|uniref:DEAD-box ATP-dependent RNA helicase 17-like n=1 Tax=Hibiscus syriacus TaxID=106335 RepID=A0A6A3A2I9_HIBSY|nr:pollen receptor-like kinase 3 [Hibiscus syriacus]KAE8698408.1 DEAD-box ATP-dependent RNA helicase 17-like [Hibiscus syriacus]
MAAVRFLLLLSLLAFLTALSFSLSDDEKALLKLKKSFTHANLDSWVSDSDPCQKKWLGVQCSGGSVVALHLTGLQLSGQIDVQALLQIRGLKAVSFINNSFTGSIPEFNNLTTLRAIYLSQNHFSGEISNDYFYPMENLKKVWLNENKFSGKIPDSLMQLPSLIELHLESNQFSGKIPRLKHPEVLNSLDLSDNKLQGEIPASFSKFEVSAFQGNDGLCGRILSKECNETDISDDNGESSGSKVDQSDKKGASSVDKSQGSDSNVVVISIASIAAVLLLVIVAFVMAKRRRREDDFSILSKEPLKEEVLQVKVSQAQSTTTTTKRKTSETSRRSTSSKKGSSHGSKGGGADLVMVNDEKGAFGMQDLMKAAAEVLGNGGLGSAYKAVMGNGLAVVVKRMKELNRLGKEAFDAEMKRIGKLRHPNILTPLAYHSKKEEKLVVSEYMPKGSLSYVLHGDRGNIHANLNWPTRLKVIKGIADGLGFIHAEFATYEIPHGNLKSSNVLLNDDYIPLLSDFAFQPLTSPDSLPQRLFAYKSPEYLQTQQISPKSDVYCLGVLILEIITGKFPSQYLNNGKGGIDIVHWVQTAILEDQAEDLIDPEISQGSSSIDQMVQLLRIGAACTASNPDQRLPLKEAIGKIHEVNP